MKAITAAILLAASLALSADALAQSAVARFKFEDAEAAFAGKQYETALVKLQEAETQFGKINPPILHLRIQARYELLRAAAVPDYDALQRLRAECMQYLSTFGNLEAVRDQAREIYRINEDLKAYPASRTAYVDLLLEHARYADAWRQMELEPASSDEERCARLPLMNRIVETEHYADADHARTLDREAQACLDASTRRSEASANLAEVRQIHRNLAGLDEYLQGKQLQNIDKDYAQGLIHMTRAAEQGSPMAMAAIGHAHAAGLGVPVDKALAAEWVQRAEAAGSSRLADSYLGFFHSDGTLKQDYVLAREWYEKAAAKGDKDAMYNVGLFYQAGRGVPVNHAKAREWFLKAAHAQDSRAAHALGVQYYKGYGTEKNIPSAIEWFTRAVDMGNAGSMVVLASLYYNGDGVEQSYATAREWYLKAASKGSSSAQYNLAVMYHAGKGVSQDHAMARGWYEKAAVHNPEARYYLGTLYEKGLSVKQDYAVASSWYEKAANGGSVKAMDHLARMYTEGRPGVKRNKARAEEWRAKAAAAREKAQPESTAG